MKRETIIKWVLYITGAICAYAFVAVRYLPMYNTTLREKVTYWDNTRYGEMYYFSMISHFREDGIPPFSRKFEHSEKQASIQHCEILTFGDSFFEFSRIKQFPEKLADDFHKKVHYVNTRSPLQFLQANSYNDTTPKLVIFEGVERYLPLTFKEEHTVPIPVIEVEQSGPEKTFDYVLNKVFYQKSEELYNVMLKRSHLTTDIYSLISTVKLDLFGYITNKTPVYKIDRENSWVFYHDQVNGEITSFYYQFTQQQIDSICDNMADLSVKLKELYNMDLVYLPVPTRYTLYHSVINQDCYNNFLPRLYEGLDRRGVKHIKIFEEYKSAPELLYFRTDEHWNQAGFDIAYNKTIDYINNHTALAYYLTNRKCWPKKNRNSDRP